MPPPPAQTTESSLDKPLVKALSSSNLSSSLIPSPTPTLFLSFGLLCGLFMLVLCEGSDLLRIQSLVAKHDITLNTLCLNLSQHAQYITTLVLRNRSRRKDPKVAASSRLAKNVGSVFSLSPNFSNINSYIL